MKNKIILFAFAGLASILLCSYDDGAAHEGGIDGTGAQLGTGCSGSTCHSSTNSLGTTLELDSAGVPVSSYYPGIAYTVKISAANSTGSNLPKFGFQLACVKAIGIGTNNAAQAGTWASTSLPTNVRNTPTSLSGLNMAIVEHSNPITATSGTGGSGTTYVESIQWTAPAAGTGTVKLCGVINAVNGNDLAESGDKYEQAAPLTITEAVSAGPNGVADLSLSAALSVYPTLVRDVVNVNMNTSLTEISYEVYGINGSLYANGTVTSNTAINMSQFSAGMYILRIADQNRTATYKLVKE